MRIVKAVKMCTIDVVAERATKARCRHGARTRGRGNKGKLNSTQGRTSLRREKIPELARKKEAQGGSTFRQLHRAPGGPLKQGETCLAIRM